MTFWLDAQLSPRLARLHEIFLTRFPVARSLLEAGDPLVEITST